MKVLIDTNVILDVLEKREGFFKDSYNVFVLCETGDVCGIISTLSIPNIVYIMRKELTPTGTMSVIETLNKIFAFADLDTDIIRSAAARLQSDYEDAIQMVQAERYGADYIITRNIKDFSDSPVPAVSPDDFIRNYESKA